MALTFRSRSQRLWPIASSRPGLFVQILRGGKRRLVLTFSPAQLQFRDRTWPVLWLGHGRHKWRRVVQVVAHRGNGSHRIVFGLPNRFVCFTRDILTLCHASSRALAAPRVRHPRSKFSTWKRCSRQTVLSLILFGSTWKAGVAAHGAQLPKIECFTQLS